MTLSLLCVREYGCISETHREEEDRRREAGGVDSEITWLTYIYSPEKGREKASGKASSVQLSAGRQLTFRLMVSRQPSKNQTMPLNLRF